MTAFIELTQFPDERHILVNVEQIISAEPREFPGGEWGCYLFLADRYGADLFETYEQVVNKIREALTRIKERKGKSPLVIPLKERQETVFLNARVREENPKRQPFAVPAVEDVAAYIREMGYTFDAQEFWHFYNCKGWMVGKNKMKDWRSACATWHKRTAQDSKGRARKVKKADNWIPPTENERKEFSYDE